jgi:hypothetical protein
MRRNFLRLAGEHPGGWDDIWTAFVAVIREPVDAPDIAYDNVLLEISAAYPPYSQYDSATLTRRVGFPAPNPASNELVPVFDVSIWWDLVEVGPNIITIVGRGPSTYKHDPAPPLDDFIAQVEQHPVVARLREADAALHRWEAWYERATRAWISMTRGQTRSSGSVD